MHVRVQTHMIERVDAHVWHPATHTYLCFTRMYSCTYAHALVDCDCAVIHLYVRASKRTSRLLHTFCVALVRMCAHVWSFGHMHMQVCTHARTLARTRCGLCAHTHVCSDDTTDACACINMCVCVHSDGRACKHRPVYTCSCPCLCAHTSLNHTCVMMCICVCTTRKRGERIRAWLPALEHAYVCI